MFTDDQFETHTIWNGRKFIVPRGDNASINYFTGTDEENIKISYQDIPLEERRLAIQAGGNLGYFPIRYSQVFDCVVTFEPEPLNFHCLDENVTEENVVKVNAALGNSHDPIAMEIPDPRHVGLNRVLQGAKGTIPQLRIDDFEFENVDLIQLDLEGYEFKALQGAEETLKRCKPYLSIEMANHANHFGDGGNDEIVKYLNDLGFFQVNAVWLDRIFKHEDRV